MKNTTELLRTNNVNHTLFFHENASLSVYLLWPLTSCLTMALSGQDAALITQTLDVSNISGAERGDNSETFQKRASAPDGIAEELP